MSLNFKTSSDGNAIPCQELEGLSKSEPSLFNPSMLSTNNSLSECRCPSVGKHVQLLQPRNVSRVKQTKEGSPTQLGNFVPP
ncbi:hypothetical protein HanPSC8_Chr11g0494281 [Helianthus annuus]|nr:hypothetical protein HanPSC8_Chr11g0494281 [Helianthus annuus]